MSDLTLAARFRVMAATGMAATIQPADLRAAAELLERAEQWAKLRDEIQASSQARQAACNEILDTAMRRHAAAVLALAISIIGWVLSPIVLRWVLA